MTTTRTNPVKAALARGRVVIGSEVSRLRGPEIPRILARAGFQFVFIDMEHSAFSMETVADLIRAGRDNDIVPIVRVPQAEYAWVTRVLDAGAMGIIVPRVDTAEMAEAIVSWTRYPPLGIRGFAATGAQTEDRDVGPVDFIRSNHAETLLVLQIERKRALENLEEILAVEGIDVACLGYMDLSVDLGAAALGNPEHPELVKGIERLIDVSSARGVAPGFIGPDMAILQRWLQRGMRFVSYSTEALLLRRAAEDAARTLRSLTDTVPVFPAPRERHAD